MRSARMILAAAAASAALAVGAPGAHAAGDTDHDSSWSKEDSSSYGKEEHGKEDHGKEDHGKEGHDSPHGGVHTGGGALASVSDGSGPAVDPRFDPETYKDKDTEKGGSTEHGKDSWNGGKEEESGGWSKEHDKPSGGMHTGGGGLATPSATAAGLGVLAVAGTGLYALRRRNTAKSVA
ncbi:hypothetical protein [Streptomyces maremycinicus]|uniref:hypothetical protein n=1 Tax=Streptomyces maremycinicus TaxID=1679753 RepID=UPI0007C66BC1|nr:hypothetical protein [Streptomyces sp. NBRC 110468]